MNRERRQIEGCNSSVSQEARPPCFVKQKLIGAREGSEAREGPIDFTINTSTGGIRKEEIQKTLSRGMRREFCNACHSTERNPEGAVMTSVIGFLQL